MCQCVCVCLCLSVPVCVCVWCFVVFVGVSCVSAGLFVFAPSTFSSCIWLFGLWCLLSVCVCLCVEKRVCAFMFVFHICVRCCGRVRVCVCFHLLCVSESCVSMCWCSGCLCVVGVHVVCVQIVWVFFKLCMCACSCCFFVWLCVSCLQKKNTQCDGLAARCVLLHVACHIVVVPCWWWACFRPFSWMFWLHGVFHCKFSFESLFFVTSPKISVLHCVKDSKLFHCFTVVWCYKVCSCGAVWCCERVRPSVPTKNHGVFEERNEWVDTQRLSFPSTAVATRKATSSTNRIQECLCAKHKSRDLNCWGLKDKIAVTEKRGARGKVRFVRCGCFSPPARMSAYNGPSEAFQLCLKQSWNHSFHCHELSHHDLLHQPSHWDDEEDGCACCSSCMWLLLTILCSCSRCLIIFTARGCSVCCFTGVVTFTLCLMFSLPELYLFTKLTWLMVFCMVTESFSHSSAPALQFL